MSLRRRIDRLREARLRQQADSEPPAAHRPLARRTPEVDAALYRVLAWANGGPEPDPAEMHHLAVTLRCWPESLRDYWLSVFASGCEVGEVCH